MNLRPYPQRTTNPPLRLTQIRGIPILHPRSAARVLHGPSQQILHALLHRPPSQTLVNERHSNAAPGLLLLLAQLVRPLQSAAAQLIRHALQLTKVGFHVELARDGQRLHQIDRRADGGWVVACEEELDFRQSLALRETEVRAGEEVVHDAVVRGIGVFFRVVDALARVRVDVGAAHEFDGEREVLLFGRAQLRGEFAAGFFQVSLQRVVDDGVAVRVVLAHEGDGPSVDAGLHGLLLRVDPEAAAEGLCLVADLVHGVGEGGGWLFVAHESFCHLGAGAGESEGCLVSNDHRKEHETRDTYFIPNQSPSPTISNVSKFPSLH